MPSAASASSTGATGRSSFSTASWKRGPAKAARTPGSRASAATSSLVRAMQARATRSRPAGPEQREVDRRRGHQQALVGADVRGRLGAADVLLARLQRQREAGLALGIHRAARDAPRHLAHVFHAAGHEADVGAAGGQRHAEGLRVAAGDVGAAVAPFARRREQRERHRIHGRDDERAVRARPARERVDVLELAEEVRLLDHDRGDVLAGELRRAPPRSIAPVRGDRTARSSSFEALSLGDRARDAAPGRVDRRRHQDARRLRAPVRAHGHQAGLGERGGAVVERGVRHVHARSGPRSWTGTRT